MVQQNYMAIGSQKYIESYNIFACSGILFNHESPLRGETFVTKSCHTQLSIQKTKKKFYRLEILMPLEIRDMLKIM